MEHNKLPTRLGKEPLLEAIFELRFSAHVPASNVLPGILYEKLEGEKKSIDQLPVAQLPQQMRDADPNLKFAPLVRLHWDNYFILIGDRSLAVACKLPYPGWTKFKSDIIKITTLLNTFKTITEIHRYSLKYVDLIPIVGIKEQVSAVNLNVQMGMHKLEKEIFQFRIEIAQEDIIHAVQILSSAVATGQDGKTKQGLIVDIDSIRNIGRQGLDELIKGFNEKLDVVHQKNKEIFFDCLSPSTVTALEPKYEQ